MKLSKLPQRVDGEKGCHASAVTTDLSRSRRIDGNARDIMYKLADSHHGSYERGFFDGKQSGGHFLNNGQ